jgi:hypothetical protein
MSAWGFVAGRNGSCVGALGRGVERVRDQGEGRAAYALETQAEAGVPEGEFFVLAFELEDAVLGGEDHFADLAVVAFAEGALDLDEFTHQAVGIHWASLLLVRFTRWSQVAANGVSRDVTEITHRCRTCLDPKHDGAGASGLGSSCAGVKNAGCG